MRVIGDCTLGADDSLNQADSSSFVFTFIILHVMVFTFGMLNYGLKVRSINCSSGAPSLTLHRTARLAPGTSLDSHFQ